MPSTSTRKSCARRVLPLVLIAACFSVAHFSADAERCRARATIAFVPAGLHRSHFSGPRRTACNLRFSQNFMPGRPPDEDSEYAQFVARHRIFLRTRSRSSRAWQFPITERPQICWRLPTENLIARKSKPILNSQRHVHAARQMRRSSARMPAVDEKPVSLAFLSDQRIAITDAANLSAALSPRRPRNPSRAEWNSRFERLAGTPLFAVIRQDPAMQNALELGAPGGFRSPQLSALLNQLQWISIAGKPDGDRLARGGRRRMPVRTDHCATTRFPAGHCCCSRKTD